jgi:hypothetical protein
MVVPRSLEADNHGSADVADPIDETIMLSSNIQNDKPVAIPAVSINTSLR